MFARLLLATTAAVAAAGSALAGDLPYEQGADAYAPPAPIFTWTGVYLGAQIGYAWAPDNIYGWTPGYSFSGVYYAPNGVVGGAHAGYSMQFNRIVAGVEGDIEGSSLNRSYVWGFITYGTQLPLQGTIRGRLGFALDRVLLYATGGAAFAGITNSYQSPFGYSSIGKSVAGWTIGGGLEYALTSNWSVRAEYRYTDFGSWTDYPLTAPLGGNVTHHLTENAVRIGAAFKFDSPFNSPAFAK